MSFLPEQFERVGRNFVIELKELNCIFVLKILKHGGIYFGESVYNVLHPTNIDEFERITIACSRSDFKKLKKIIPKFYGSFFSRKKATSKKVELFEYSKNNILCKVLVFHSTKNILINDLQDCFDFDKFAVRLYHKKKKLFISVPCDPETNPMSTTVYLYPTDIKTNFDILRLQVTMKRFSKWDTYVIEQSSIEKLLENFICCICFQKTDIMDCWLSKCNHKFHYSCFRKWITFEPGDEIIQSKTQCPVCRTFLGQEYFTFNVERCNFEVSIYTCCLFCTAIIVENKQSCENESFERTFVCTNCQFQKSLEHRILVCPECGLELQHAGGCSRFACCLYGVEKCGIGCNHGTTEFTKFCGHHWTIELVQ